MVGVANSATLPHSYFCFSDPQAIFRPLSVLDFPERTRSGNICFFLSAKTMELLADAFEVGTPLMEYLLERPVEPCEVFRGGRVSGHHICEPLDMDKMTEEQLHSSFRTTKGNNNEKNNK